MTRLRSVSHVARVQCLAYVGGYLNDGRKLERIAAADLRRGDTACALDNGAFAQTAFALAAIYFLHWLLREEP